MIRRDALSRTPWLTLAALLVAVAGCVSPQVRTQSDEGAEAEVKYDVQTVGDVTDVGNADPIQVGGVGLVIDLEGTGGSAPPGSYRTLLEDQLRKNRQLLDSLLKQYGVKDVKELLALPSVSLVLVSASVPPGAHKGDPIDVDVSLPADSKTTSLRGGRLVECSLFNYELASALSPKYGGNGNAIKGHAIARAEGHVLVGFGEGEDARQRSGRIWAGARCKIDRPVHLILKDKQQHASIASAVADRVNTAFHSAAAGLPGNRIAVAENKTLVQLSVPHQYRHNLPRYLRVVRLVPLREAGDQARTGEDGVERRISYRRALEQDLVKPGRTVLAALRLEALGNRTVPVLKTALGHEHALVRFSAAEALTYLGSPAGAEELARMVEEHPALRAFSLTALASLDEAVCHVKLRELLASSKAETRYGAFRALRALDERDPSVQGEMLNEAFWLHHAAPDSAPLVHVSSNRRAEVVLFGDDAHLKPPFAFRAGDFNITAGQDDDRCTIGLFSPSDGKALRRQCSLKVEDVLRTMAAMGGMYPEAVEVLRQAHVCQCLSCQLEADALPQAVSVQELARAGVGDPEGLLADEEILNAKPDLGVTPTLYERDGTAEGDRKPAKRSGGAEGRAGALE
jgi:flagellar basal body P-ring protein FlgI